MPAARMLLPNLITDAILTDTDAAEPGPGEQVFDAATIYKARDQVILGSPSGTVTISNGSPAVVTWTGHGLPVGTPVVLTTSGTLPAGFTAGQRYFIVKTAANTLRLAETADGAAISTTTAGSGTHTATAEVHETYESLIGDASTVTLAIASPGQVGWADHGLVAGTPVAFSTTGALPTGLTAGTTYYVLTPTQNAFTVAPMAGGTVINFTGSESGVHTATANPNIGNPPAIDDGTRWANVGPTNRWAMFDYLTDQRTWAESPFSITLTPGQRIDTTALDRVVADAVNITVDDSGTIYDVDINLSTRIVTGWLDYFTAPFSTRADLARFDLPLRTNATVTLTFTRASGLVGVGALGIGRFTDLGTALVEPEDEDLNFSTFERNIDGTPSVLIQRRSVPKLTFRTVMESILLAGARAARKAANAAPAFFFVIDDADHDYAEAASLLGVHQSWTHTLDQPAPGYVTASITVEGP